MTSIGREFWLQWNMRIVGKQRRISRKRSGAHLRWNSETHKVDQGKADGLRAMVQVQAKIVREPFPSASEIATQYLYEPGQDNVLVPEKVEGEAFETKLAKLARQRSFYRGEVGEGRTKKRPTKAITDTYISIPPWWTKALAEAVRGGTMSKEQVQAIVSNIGHHALMHLCKRSGYEPVYFSIHPDSTNNLHIHLGVSTVSKDNKLVGRSAKGGRGKKGLRHAGDSDLALYRMAKVNGSIIRPPVLQKIMKGDFDDISLSEFVDAELEKRLFSLKPRAQTFATEHVTSWMQDAKDKKLANNPSEVSRLRAENKSLKAENERLRVEVRTLHDHILSVSPDIP